MTIKKATRLKGLSAETRRLLAAAPDEHAVVEFKRAPADVKDAHISALANTAALEGVGAATVLVGFGQELDDRGWLQPKLLGLTPSDCSKGKRGIYDRASNVEAQPPLVEIFEENVSSDRPILRVVIRPTSPPHYDQAGRRAKRVGENMVPMTDAEMLRLLTERLKGTYADVARVTATEMAAAQRQALDDQLYELLREAGADGGEDVEALREDVARSFEELGGEMLEAIANLEAQIVEVPERVVPPTTAEDVARDLLAARQAVAIRIAIAWDDLPEDLLVEAQELLEAPIDPWDFVGNSRELAALGLGVTPAKEEGTKLATELRQAIDARRDLEALKVDLSAVRAQVREAQNRVSKRRRRR